MLQKDGVASWLLSMVMRLNTGSVVKNSWSQSAPYIALLRSRDHMSYSYSWPEHSESACGSTNVPRICRRNHAEVGNLRPAVNDRFRTIVGYPRLSKLERKLLGPGTDTTVRDIQNLNARGPC